MPSRIAQAISDDEIAKLFAGLVRRPAKIPRRGNLGIGSQVVVAIPDAGIYQLVPMEWGLPTTRPLQPPDHNARMETYCSGKRSKWSAFRRCVVPVTGWYEWKATRRGREPMFIRKSGGGPLAIAGLFKTFTVAGQESDRFVVMTTRPNDLVGPIHDRMAALLSPEHLAQWADESIPAAEFKKILRPWAPSRLQAYRVGPGVSDRNDQSEGLFEPIA